MILTLQGFELMTSSGLDECCLQFMICLDHLLLHGLDSNPRSQNFSWSCGMPIPFFCGQHIAKVTPTPLQSHYEGAKKKNTPFQHY